MGKVGSQVMMGRTITWNGSSVKNELACSSFIYTYAVTYDLTNAQSRAQYRSGAGMRRADVILH